MDRHCTCDLCMEAGQLRPKTSSGGALALTPVGVQAPPNGRKPESVRAALGGAFWLGADLMSGEALSRHTRAPLPEDRSLPHSSFLIPSREARPGTWASSSQPPRDPGVCDP